MDATAAEKLAWTVRDEVYRHLGLTGRVPGRGSMAGALDVSHDAIDDALAFLAEAHVLALQPSGEVWMAHPFSAVETPFIVETATRSHWANCAWDALAIPLLLGVDGRTETECPQTGTPISLTVEAGAVEAGGAVIHLPVPARRFWDDIAYT